MRGLQQMQHMGSVVFVPGLESTGSVFVAHRLRCYVACGIFPDQGLNLCLLHWQADSLPVSHQGKPIGVLILVFLLLNRFDFHCML